MARVAVYITGALLGLVALVTVASVVLVAEYRIPSESMTPALPVGSRAWVSRSGGTAVARDDIVVWRADAAPFERITRVVAVEGDTVRSRDHRLEVNGQPVVEDFLAPGTITDGVDESSVPIGAVYVLGDNRTNSADSRHFGPIRVDQIVGTVSIRRAPPRVGLIGLTVLLGFVFALCVVSWRRSVAGPARSPDWLTG